jgi:hypothetical protein
VNPNPSFKALLFFQPASCDPHLPPSPRTMPSTRRYISACTVQCMPRLRGRPSLPTALCGIFFRPLLRMRSCSFLKLPRDARRPTHAHSILARMCEMIRVSSPDDGTSLIPTTDPATFNDLYLSQFKTFSATGLYYSQQYTLLFFHLCHSQ